MIAKAVLDEATEALFESSERVLREELEGSTAGVVILLPWRSAPPDRSRNDGTVHSFLCTEAVRSRLPADCPRDRLCYVLLKMILDGELAADRILIRQLPYIPDDDRPPAEECAAAMLMAHRGSIDHLRVALSNLPAGLRIRVGLDVEDAGTYQFLAASFPGVEFYTGYPAPVGPYLIRQELAELSPEPVFVFHDSDDVSCSDRMGSLRAEMGATGCDLIGCHELMVDEVAEEVRVFRYPLDVVEALRAGPYYSLLHGTSMIKREAFFAAGGFSTDRMISIDMQFLYRAYFRLRIRNADRFLYIRRRHAGALTVHPATSIRSDQRREIERSWAPDFEAVKMGKLELSKSTLMPVRASVPHELVPFSR